ncbi:hypothetical protein [Cupriavidus pauculus]|uniref:hypothetical protein n=1 Tax=Cupriavidus pauculus TaxID=82633 RepID=UPI001D0CC6F8|nr:hypothetical protein [Cupriavidus pauculus]
MHQHSEVSQLTAKAGRQQTVGACRETLRQAHVAVVRHVPVADGTHHIAAFVLDPGLPDGTRLYTGGQLLMVEEGDAPATHAHEEYPGGPAYACDGQHCHPVGSGRQTAHAVYDPRSHAYMAVDGAHAHSFNTPRWGLVTPEGLVTSVPSGPIKATSAELLKIFHDLKSVDVLAGVEPGSHGDAILVAYARTVLQHFGVQLTEERA